MRNNYPILLIIFALLVQSCNKEGGDSGFTIHTLLTSIESTNYDKNELSIFDISYAGYNENGEKVPIILGEKNIYGSPIISKIVAKNSYFKEVRYTYINAHKYLDIAIKNLNDSTINQSYKLNRLEMAEEIFNGKDYEIMRGIKYNDGGYRKEWRGYELLPSEGVYINAQSSDSISVEYLYTLNHNTLGVQQFGIIGAELHLNITKNFGKQSQKLLSKVKITEKGVTNIYEFNYTIDSFGNILEETIIRNKERYLRNIYSYSSALTNK